MFTNSMIVDVHERCQTPPDVTQTERLLLMIGSSEVTDNIFQPSKIVKKTDDTMPRRSLNTPKRH